MKAYEIQGKSLEHIKQVERKKPEINSNEVLVKIKAALLNYRDYMIAKGFYRVDLSYPIIPLSDGAG